MKSLSREQSNEIGRQVETLIANEMSYIVNWYVSRYQASVRGLFGWGRDDLMQNVRVVLWKGVATFDSSKNFKIETYLSSILKNYFSNLTKRCRIARKNGDSSSGDLSIDSPAEAPDRSYMRQYQSPMEQPDEALHKTTSVLRFMERLDDFEFQVLELSVYGRAELNDEGRKIRKTYSTTEIAEMLQVPRNQVSIALKSLRIELAHHIRKDEDDGDNL